MDDNNKVECRDLMQQVLTRGAPLVAVGFDLEGINLVGAGWLRGANLSHSILCFANLDCADLTGANLSGCDMAGAKMDSAILRNANVCRTNFRKADLRDVDFRNADTRWADFRDARLDGAIFDAGYDPLAGPRHPDDE